MLVLLGQIQAVDAELGGVVQEGHPRQALRMLGQRSVEVRQIPAVAPDLLDRVEDRAGVRVDLAQPRVAVDGGRRTPLLELHHHVGGLAGPRVQAGQHHVRPLAAERQAVLDQHLDLAEARVDQGPGDQRDTPLPGTHLARAGPVAVHVDELLGQSQGQRAGHALSSDGSGRIAEQQEMPPGSTK